MKKKTDRSQHRGLLIVSGFALLVILGGVICYLLSREQRKPDPAATAPSTEAIPLNTYDVSEFRSEGGRVSFPGALTGIDVSAHQKEIDWERVRADGIDFAIIRVGYRGYSEGGLYEDAYFKDNIEGALRAGLKVGAYFFSQAASEAEAVEEAEYTLRALRGYSLEMPVFFDWENQASGRTAEVPLLDVSDYAAAFCRTVEAAGYRGGVYFNQVYGYSFRLSSLLPYAFWLAEYNDTLSFYYDVDYWQFSCQGSVDGIELDVDLNLFFRKEN